MYGWIWRKLPFGLPGKITGSVVLILAVMATLWYGVFPAAERFLPFGDVQVTDNSGGAGDDSGGQIEAPPSASSSDFVIPYSTASDNAAPKASATRRPSPSPTRRR